MFIFVVMFCNVLFIYKEIFTKFARNVNDYESMSGCHSQWGHHTKTSFNLISPLFLVPGLQNVKKPMEMACKCFA